MKTGITGATGQLGRLVVEKLKEKTGAENLVALVRTPEKAADLEIESRAFDYSKADGLVKSLQGIDHLLLISGSEIGQREVQHKNVINAAKEAGVKWIVYTSILHADKSPLGLAPEHIATEEALKKSGIPYTILRNGWYTENYTASVPSALEAGAFIGSAGEGKISSAARVDYAEAAVVVLTSPDQEGKTYELSGDETYTLTDFAAVLSKVTGKTIPYQNLSETEYAGVLAEAGLPEGLAQAFASFDASAEKNALFNDSKELSTLIGHPTTSLEDVIKSTIA